MAYMDPAALVSGCNLLWVLKAYVGKGKEKRDLQDGYMICLLSSGKGLVLHPDARLTFYLM